MTRRLLLFLLVFAGVGGPALVGIPVGMRRLHFLAGALLVSAWAASGKPAGRRGRAILTVIVSMGLALSFADLAGHLVRPYFYRSAAQVFTRVWPPIPILHRYAANVTHEGETFGDLAARSGVREHQVRRPSTFRTDSHGFRNDPSLGQAGSAPFDVVLLGDSFGAGAGARHEKSWASLFIRDYGLNTYNLSAGGVSPWQELLTLQAEGARLRLSPKTVVLWALFTGNDLDELYGDPALPAPQPWWAQIQVAYGNFRSRSLVADLVHSIVSSRRAAGQIVVRDISGGRKMLFHADYRAAKDRSPAAVQDHPNYARLVAVFEAMSRRAKTNGFPVGVVLIPPKEEVYGWLLDPNSAATSGFSVVIRDLCAKEGLPFLDLGPSFSTAARESYERSGELLYWADDTHWNERGHELAASVVYDRLLRAMLKVRSAQTP